MYGILKGNKPDFHVSMKSNQSKEFYDAFVKKVIEDYKKEKVQGTVVTDHDVLLLSVLT